LILLLTGVSTRIRLWGSVSLAIVSLLVGNLFGVVTSSLNLYRTPETPIPTSFTTYTNEGFFSISFPPYWVSDSDSIKEAQKYIEEFANQNMVGNVSKEQVVFLGNEEAFHANVIVTVQSKPILPLSSIVEATDEWLKANKKQYNEYYRAKTSIGGRSAIMSSYEYYDSVLYRCTAGYILGDKLLWSMVCICESSESNSYLNTFNDIIRSLRVKY
jgi:hypothetical protein